VAGAHRQMRPLRLMSVAARCTPQDRRSRESACPNDAERVQPCVRQGIGAGRFSLGGRPVFAPSSVTVSL